MTELEKLKEELQQKMREQEALEERIQRLQIEPEVPEVQEPQEVEELQEKQEPQEVPEPQGVSELQEEQEPQELSEIHKVPESQEVQELQDEQEPQELSEIHKAQGAQEIPEFQGVSEDELSEEEDDLQELVIPQEESAGEKKTRRKKKMIGLVYNLLIVVGVCLLLYGGYSLYDTYRDEKEAEADYGKIKDNYVQVPNISQNSGNSEGDETQDGMGTEGTSGTEEARPREWYEMIWVDLKGMQTQINPDIVGWIFFENEDISYPILYSEDNAEYDRVMYNYEYSRGGSITLEAANSWDFSDIRNVIYGHNMTNETMFGKLRKYDQIEGYYQEHQYFQLLYDGMVYRYQIFSYFKIHEKEVSYINVDFEVGSDEYEAFVKNLVEKSTIDTGISVSGADKTVTLLTCAPNNTYRFLVNAVLVDQHAMADENGKYPDEPDTEIGTEPDATESEDTETENDSEASNTQDSETESEDNSQRPGSENYTYTDIGKYMWATTGVKVRNQPSTDGIRIGYLSKDMEVYVEAVCNETGWYRVHVNRMTGYVNGYYLTDVKPVTEPTESESTTPGSETPGTETPGTETPGTETPGTETPETETPGTETPETETPGTETPGTETPGTETPGTETPGSTEPGTTESTTTESESTSESETESQAPSESQSDDPADEPSIVETTESAE